MNDDNSELVCNRKHVADMAMSAYEFGPQLVVDDYVAWRINEAEDGSTLYRATLYMSSDVEGNDCRLFFTVRFPENSIEPSAVRAVTMGRGLQIGHSPPSVSAPSP